MDFMEFKIDFLNLKLIFQFINSAQVMWRHLDRPISSRSTVKIGRQRGSLWSVPSCEESPPSIFT